MSPETINKAISESGNRENRFPLLLFPYYHACCVPAFLLSVYLELRIIYNANKKTNACKWGKGRTVKEYSRGIQQMKQYIVDAFTDKPFSGNPAAVCIMDSWPSEESMMKLAMENNLSETAFIVREEAGYHLRWFTPGTEVELCGHATLASSYVILSFCEPESSEVHFNTLSGVLTVRKNGDLYEMDFPTYPLKEIPVTDAMEQAFGIRPVKAVLGLDLICVFENEDQVRQMQPDQARLMEIEGRIQNVTAKGTETDCVSRSFCPKLSVAEDPVCGSAHCQIADYWAGELGKKNIFAYQASKRGGYLYCEMREDGRINISGKATLVAIADIVADL